MPNTTIVSWVTIASMLFLSSCDGDSAKCEGVEGATTCFPAALKLPVRVLPAQRQTASVNLYVDRSGSMTGYLDSLFEGDFGLEAGSSSLRRLLNRLLVTGGSPVRVYGFGEHVIAVKASSNQDVIAQLVRREFYTDNNTRLEDVLDSIARDSSRSSVHLIISDGRRDDGPSAIAQYTSLGKLARAWTIEGDQYKGPPGIFVLAAIQAPFHPARKKDKSGCWSASESTFRCPIYVMAFAPQQSSKQVLAPLREVANRLFVTPAFSDTSLTLDAKVTGGASHLLHIDGGGRTGRPLHLMFTSPDSVLDVKVDVTARLEENDARYAADDSLTVTMQGAAMVATERPGSWETVHDYSSAWAKPQSPTRDLKAQRLLLPILLRARPQVTKTRYRVAILSTGRPGWFSEYEASRQGDSTRTYGLSALIEHLQPTSSTLASFYVAIF